MTHSAFSTEYDDLPETLAIFPLQGVALLPFTRLDLNIFEPRYLNMIIDSLANQRLIGMVQPSQVSQTETIGDTDSIQDTGCAGRIVSFNETGDGRLVIALQGVVRFKATRELALLKGYRRVAPEWGLYRHDLQPASTDGLKTELVLRSASSYLKSHSMDANLDTLKSSGVESVVNTLAVHLPFSSEQKQTLLRSKTLHDRYQMLIALCELDTDRQDDAPLVKH